MKRLKIVWSSGKESTVDVDNPEEYLTLIFGHPTRFPDGVEVTYLGDVVEEVLVPSPPTEESDKDAEVQVPLDLGSDLPVKPDGVQE